MKKLLFTLFLCTFFLASCSSDVKETTVPTTEAPPVEELTMIVTAEDISQLEDFPALKTVDLTGSTCYAEIEAYMQAHLEVEVIYTVDLGGTAIAPDMEELTLPADSFRLSAFDEALSFLHKLKSVSFQDMQLSMEEYEALKAAHPNVSFDYDIAVGDIVFGAKDETIDLSGFSWEELEPNLAKLSLLPELTVINLIGPEGETQLTFEQAAELQQLLPDAFLRCSFDLFGQTVTTEQEEVVYANKYIGNKIEGAEETLRQALSMMKGCKRLVLDNCHFTDETLAQLRDDFRGQTKIVWRVSFGADGGCLTDRETIRYMPTLTGDNGKRLYYCEDAKYIDFGHDEGMMHCEYIGGMVSLEAAILSGSPIKDISGFGNCPNLEFLELAFCAYVEDISALANCTNLKRLNLAYTKVSDLSALDGIELEIFVAPHAKISDEEWERFEELHPGCIVQRTGEQPYGYPWRYTEDGKYNDYYAMLREVFNYENPTQTRR